MISQVASIDETLLTPKTFVRSLSSVKSHVDFKVVSRSNTFSTVRAGERLFSGVSSHVLFKGFLTCITLSTPSASERLLSSVSSHVDFNVCFFEEISFHTEGRRKASFRCEFSSVP